MSWNKSGDERAKSFQVYKNLELSYKELQQRYASLEARLKEKDETLLRLSRELYQALEGGQDRPRTSVTVQPGKPTPHLPHPRPGIVSVRAEVPMSELLGDSEHPPAQTKKEA